jgi:DNA-binding HxlR family transcriptional regulator
MKKSKPEDCRSGCPISHVLDILGDRWSFIIIRDMLLFGRHEFHEFMDAGEGISTNILTDRLKHLMKQGIVNLRLHPTNKKRKFYYLTQKGRDLMPVIHEMVCWAGTYIELNEIARKRIAAMKKDPQAFMKRIFQEADIWEKSELK